MNFLAHVYLSGNDEEVLVGNFIGDFVKGSQMKQYPSGIQKGIRLHRSIDHFTDTHEVVRKSKVRLREKFRHYAPVIVDVFYDHFLAKNWANYSKVPLMDYTQQFYERMKDHYKVIPAGVVRMLGYMAEGNWLFNYQFIEGIDRALTGMSRRTKFESKMEEATIALKNHYSDFQQEFNEFFPELQTHVNNFDK